MPLKKGSSNSGIKNLIPFRFPKGKSGYHFNPRNIFCVDCKKEFKTTGPRSLYCSAKCKERNRPEKQKTEFLCNFCGIKFKRRAPNNAGKFCSRQCSGLWTTANGENNYFYKAFLKKPHCCELCSNPDFSVLVVHHKDRNHSNNNIENLQILCANCHYRIHYGNGSTRYKKLLPILEYLKSKNKESESAFNQRAV